MLSYTERRNLEQDKVIKNVPVLTKDDIEYINGKPHKSLGKFGTDRQYVIAVYDKTIKQTKIYLAPHDLVMTYGSSNEKFNKIVYENGEKGDNMTVLDEIELNGRLRIRNGHRPDCHELWIRESSEVFRIARMQSHSKLYLRVEGQTSPFSECNSIGNVDLVRHIMDKPEDFHISLESNTFSILLKKESNHFFILENGKPRYSHLNLNMHDGLFHQVPEFFLDSMINHLESNLSPETKEVIKYMSKTEKSFRFENKSVTIGNLVRYIHFPNTVYLTHYPMALFWTQTARKKPVMKQNELVQYFYPNVSKKTARRIASQYTIEGSAFGYGGTYAAYFSSKLDNNAMQKFLELDNPNSILLANAVEVDRIDSNVKKSVSFKTIDSMLKKIGVYDLLIRRFHNMIHKYDESQRRQFKDNYSVFKDSMQMFENMYADIHFNEDSLYKDIDLARVFQHAQTEQDVHDILVRELRNAREHNTAIEREKSKFSYDHSDKALALQAEIENYSFKLPDTSIDVQNVGDDLNICVGWSYPEAMRDGKLLILPVYNKSGNPVVCIELDSEMKTVRQVKLKHNQRVEHSHPVHSAIATWVKNNNLELSTYDFSLEPIVEDEYESAFGNRDLFVAENNNVENDLPF